MNGRPAAGALAVAVRLLEARGFALVERNERGDSFYFRPADCPWFLRLSNHARTAKQRARRCDILTSLIIDGPRAPERVEALVEGALRNFRAARARKSDQASAAGSRK